MSTANSKNTKINAGRPEGELPSVEFHIKSSQEGMESSFQPFNSVTGKDILVCLALGVRGILSLLSAKLDMPMEDLYSSLCIGMDKIFDPNIAAIIDAMAQKPGLGIQEIRPDKEDMN